MIRECFGTADELPVVATFPEDFSRAEFAIVVETHGMSMSAGVVDHDKIANRRVRNLAVDRKLVIVFAKRSGDIVHFLRATFLSGNGDVMVGAIHAWTHEIRHTRVETDVVLVGRFFVEHA